MRPANAAHGVAVRTTRSDSTGPVRHHARWVPQTRPWARARRVPDETPPPAFPPRAVRPVSRDTVIVATTAGGETLTSRPMPRLQAEMLLILGVRGGHGRVNATGIVEASLRSSGPAGDAAGPPLLGPDRSAAGSPESVEDG